MNILLCGHACGPGLGSEPGLTWNWAWHLAERHQVWALVHPQHKDAIEEHIGRHPRGSLKFVWVSLPKWIDPWNPKAGEKNLRLHYLLWQRAALREARRLQRVLRFDLCHYVSWGTINCPPALWKLSIPFVWGPLGGGQTAPLEFRSYLGQHWYREALRNCRVNLAKFAPSFSRAVRASSLILATNRATKKLLEQAGASPAKVHLFLDNGVLDEVIAEKPFDHPTRRGIVLHWSGRLEPRKALPLALEAVSQAIMDGATDLSLEVSGDGPERLNYERLAVELGISNQVRFLGRIPRPELFSHFRNSDALIFTSLQDSFGSVCLEAMTQGLPLLILDHQGVGDFVPHEASWRVPPSSPSRTVEGFAAAIRQIVAHRDDRLRRAYAALEFAKLQSWRLRAEQMECLYEQYCSLGLR